MYNGILGDMGAVGCIAMDMTKERRKVIWRPT